MSGGDVAVGAVGVAGADGEREACVRAPSRTAWAGRCRCRRAGRCRPGRRGAGADPVDEGAGRGGCRPRRACLRCAGRPRRALVTRSDSSGRARLIAAPGHLAGEAVVVALRVVAEEGEHEAVLAAGRAVAGSGVAPGGGEDGHDVELEADRARVVGVLDRDGDLADWPRKSTARSVGRRPWGRGGSSRLDESCRVFGRR